MGGARTISVDSCSTILLPVELYTKLSQSTELIGIIVDIAQYYFYTGLAYPGGFTVYNLAKILSFISLLVKASEENAKKLGKEPLPIILVADLAISLRKMAADGQSSRPSRGGLYQRMQKHLEDKEEGKENKALKELKRITYYKLIKGTTIKEMISELFGDRVRFIHSAFCQADNQFYQEVKWLGDHGAAVTYLFSSDMDSIAEGCADNVVQYMSGTSIFKVLDQAQYDAAKGYPKLPGGDRFFFNLESVVGGNDYGTGFDGVKATYAEDLVSQFALSESPRVAAILSNAGIVNKHQQCLDVFIEWLYTATNLQRLKTPLQLIRATQKSLMRSQLSFAFQGQTRAIIVEDYGELNPLTEAVIRSPRIATTGTPWFYNDDAHKSLDDVTLLFKEISGQDEVDCNTWTPPRDGDGDGGRYYPANIMCWIVQGLTSWAQVMCLKDNDDSLDEVETIPRLNLKVYSRILQELGDVTVMPSSLTEIASAAQRIFWQHDDEFGFKCVRVFVGDGGINPCIINGMLGHVTLYDPRRVDLSWGSRFTLSSLCARWAIPPPGFVNVMTLDVKVSDSSYAVQMNVKHQTSIRHLRPGLLKRYDDESKSFVKDFRGLDDCYYNKIGSRVGENLTTEEPLTEEGKAAEEDDEAEILRISTARRLPIGAVKVNGELQLVVYQSPDQLLSDPKLFKPLSPSAADIVAFLEEIRAKQVRFKLNISNGPPFIGTLRVGHGKVNMLYYSPTSWVQLEDKKAVYLPIEVEGQVNMYRLASPTTTLQLKLESRSSKPLYAVVMEASLVSDASSMPESNMVLVQDRTGSKPRVALVKPGELPEELKSKVLMPVNDSEEAAARFSRSLVRRVLIQEVDAEISSHAKVFKRGIDSEATYSIADVPSFEVPDISAFSMLGMGVVTRLTLNYKNLQDNKTATTLGGMFLARSPGGHATNDAPDGDNWLKELRANTKVLEYQVTAGRRSSIGGHLVTTRASFKVGPDGSWKYNPVDGCKDALFTMLKGIKDSDYQTYGGSPDRRYLDLGLIRHPTKPNTILVVMGSFISLMDRYGSELLVPLSDADDDVKAFVKHIVLPAFGHKKNDLDFSKARTSGQSEDPALVDHALGPAVGPSAPSTTGASGAGPSRPPPPSLDKASLEFIGEYDEEEAIQKATEMSLEERRDRLGARSFGAGPSHRPAFNQATEDNSDDEAPPDPSGKGKAPMIYRPTSRPLARDSDSD